MNSDQLNSFIRSLFKIVGAALVTHGCTKAAGLVNSEDITGLVITIIGVLASHNWHTDKTSPPLDSGGSSAGKALLVFAFASLLFTGCVASNPARLVITTSPAGITTTNIDATAPAYVIDARLTNNIATAQTVASYAAPVVAAVVPVAAPVAPLLPGLVSVFGSLFVMLSGVFAWYKNRQANQQAAAAAALAATIPPASHAAALANAATNGSTAAVAVALTASQSPT